MGNYSLQHGYASALRLVSESPDFTAIVCGDAMIAFEAMAGLKSRGFRIPEDLAVTGFANDPLTGVMDPGLTGIHYPMVEMGRRAFEVFRTLRDSGGRSTPHEELAAQLIVRRSTDPSCPRLAQSPLMEPLTRSVTS
jgi:DNA-binding LacI/PurR family transcriptional regulator